MIHGTIFGISITVADIMKDIWLKRDKFVEEDQERQFCFRISMSDHEQDISVNVFLHFILTRGHWWSLINDEDHFCILPVDVKNSSDPNRACNSWRRYAFQDVIKNQVENRLREKSEEFLTSVDQVTLWNTFPLVS